MKRALCLIICIVLLVGMSIQVAALGEDSGNIDINKIYTTQKAGDVNNDKVVNAVDLSEMRKFLLFDDEKRGKVYYDVNRDGTIDIRDLVRAKKIIVENNNG